MTPGPNAPRGFLTGLFSTVGPQIDRRHDEEQSKQKARRADIWTQIQDTLQHPDKYQDPQSQVNTLWTEYQKLVGPETKKRLSPIGKLFEKLHPKPQQQDPSQPSSQGSQPPQGSAAAPSRPSAQSAPDAGAPPQQSSSTPPPQPAATSAPSSSGGSAPQMSTPQQQMEQEFTMRKQRMERFRSEAKEMGLTSERDVANYVMSQMGTRELPGQPAAATRQPVRFQLEDGKTEVDVQYDPKTGTYYDNRNEPYEVPDGAKRVSSKSSSARPTIIASDYVNVSDAKKLKDSGLPFLGADGKELDLGKIPSGMVLQKVHYADGRTLYEPRNINDKVITVGNVRYAVNPSEVQQLPSGAGTELGVANPGSSGTRGQITVDAEGNPTVTNLPSTRTPSTTGIPGRPSGGPDGPAAARHAQPTAAPRAAPAGAPAANAARPPGPPPPGIPVGMYNQMLQRITPVREAATQLFGDPSQPDIKGLKDFAALADNADSRKRLGKALKLTFDSFSKASGESGIHAGAGPISLNASGGVIQLLENAFGVPPKLAEQSAKIMQDAISGLSPEEREAYDATMSAFGTIVGLRSLTKASAAQASVATIEREMPIIGVNTSDSTQFVDQMTRLAEIVYNGTKGVPKAMWEQTPGLLEHIKDLPSEAKKIKKSGAPSKAPASIGRSGAAGRMINVQIPGHPPGRIPASAEGQFLKDNPGAKVIP